MIHSKTMYEMSMPEFQTSKTDNMNDCGGN